MYELLFFYGKIGVKPEGTKLNYEEAIRYIHSTEKFGSVLGLDTIKTLMEMLGNPQDELRVIHVAGTNGKGSVCTMLAAVLTKAGYKTGLYTSPFLERFNERIRIDGCDISDEDIAKYTEKVSICAEKMTEEGHPHPTEFELITAMAFLYYRDMKCDVVVLEVGLGGRLDATNIVKKPELEIITSIGLDHTEYLGNTLREIAGEKGGIIKPETTVVCYPSDKEAVDEIGRICRKRNAELVCAREEDIETINISIDGTQLRLRRENPLSIGTFRLSLIGRHQSMNVLTVLTAVFELIGAGYEIERDDVLDALENVRFAGRFEVLSRKPLIIIDGGHNVDGIKSFAQNVKLCFPDRKINLFYGMLADKDYTNSIDLLIPLAERIHTLRPDSPRALSAERLSEIIRERHPSAKAEPAGYEDIMGLIRPDGINAFVGSLYMIGRIRTLINQELEKSESR